MERFPLFKYLGMFVLSIPWLQSGFLHGVYVLEVEQLKGILRNVIPFLEFGEKKQL